MRLTRAERSEQIRTELVEAAYEVFTTRGFHGASLEDISLAAGVTGSVVASIICVIILDAVFAILLRNVG